MDYLDMSSAASGMTYRSSVVPAGVTVNGTLDAVGTALPSWEAYSGSQGTVLTTLDFTTSVSLPGGMDGAVDWFYRDQASPPEAQCWGDSSLYGAAGPWVVTTIPNTDPRSVPFDTWQADRIVQFGAPPLDGALVDELATMWSIALDNPIDVTVASYAP
jgi:hypothetical protein